MKKNFLFTMLLILSVASFCQQTNPSSFLTKADYLQRNKHQKTVAWILLGVGAIAFAVAAPGNVSFDVLGPLVIAGSLSTLGSIILFIASARNKRKAMAASVFLKIEKAPVLRDQAFAYRSFPAISVTVNL